ncbi:MAG: hypothetical protein Q7R49_01845 [Candidatus Daviesbacteria bacterium]|nr:hypothetical protein [Candidatus Daviesbacteria bacterium]
MLETITDPTKTNIHFLNLEEPQRLSEFPGDVRTWIPAELADGMQYRHPYLPAPLWDKIDDERRAQLILFSETYPVPTNPATREVLRTSILQLHNTPSAEGATFLMLFRQAANAKFLFPDEELINDSEWDMIKKYLQTVDWPGNYSYFQYAAAVKMLSPEKAQEFDLDNDRSWQLGLQILKDSREANGWLNFIKTAAYMKIINPEKFKEFEITEADWKSMKEYLLKGPGAPGDKVERAAEILTLQADEIKLTPEGVEVIMPEPKTSFKEEVPALPEVRKF